MHSLSSTELDRIAAIVQRGPTEGYPALTDRLMWGTPGLLVCADDATLVVPSGPWQVRDHPNRHNVAPQLLDPEIPEQLPCMPADRVAQWRGKGGWTDQHGRPVHPYWSQLLRDRRIGLPTGIGAFWHFGANPTVDAAVYRRRAATVELLLIQRRDSQLWALPGGYRDATDADDEATARRETAEETGLTEIGGTAEVLLRCVPVGSQATLHAWTENVVVLIHGDNDYLTDVAPRAGSDAVDVGWFTQHEIRRLRLADRHGEYIAKIFRHLN